MKRFGGVVVTLALATGAQAATINFDATPEGAKTNPFVATGEPGLTFFSFVPDSLSVINRPVEGNGTPGLLISGEDNGNFLFAQFDVPATSVSFDFGNDDPLFSIEGDVAVLFALDAAGELLGISTVVLNRNDLMDQTISYSGAPFASFAFAFDAPDLLFGRTGPGAAGVGLSELIDNIIFEPVSVPAPGTACVMLIGLGLLGGALRRRGHA